MNQLLQNRYNELGKEEVQDLKHRMKDSPKILRLISLLESKRDKKLNTVDLVHFLYEGEAESFEVLRNRFFKLRKQLLSLMEKRNAEHTGVSIELLPLEEKLFKCRRLIAENHFQLARKELKSLVDECREQNVFELLPEAISQLVSCCMAMNLLNEIDKLADEMIDASKLLDDFRTMQVLGRKTYLAFFSRSVPKVDLILKQMRRLAIRRADWPRFRIYYHFCVFCYTSTLPGKGTKSSVRHLTSLRRLIAKYPGMPSGHYEPNGSAMMEFYILTGEGALHFMKGNMQACYQNFKDAWEIQERIPNLRLRKSESQFSNRIAIEIATGRYREALKTADELIEFQKEQRQEEKRLRAYAEIAMIYSYAWPQLICPNPDFIIRQLKEYISVMRKSGSPGMDDGNSTLVIFYFLAGEWKAANKLAADEGVKKVFRDSGLEIYNRLLLLNPASPPEKIAEITKELDKMLLKDYTSDMMYSVKRARSFIRLLQEAVKKD